MNVLLATNNVHKVEEMRSILSQRLPHLKLHTLNDVGIDALDVEESGLTLEENAYIKAMAFFKASSMPCIADDTGLEIDALNGAPGVHTARFAGEQATAADNIARVMQEMSSVAPGQRQAQFRTVICYVDDQRCLFVEGQCDGSIATEQQGAAGFGYDPIFIPNGDKRSFAQMSADEKNAISHRGLALQNFAITLEQYFGDEANADKSASTEASRHSSRELHLDHRRTLCMAAAAAAVQNTSVLSECIDEWISSESTAHNIDALYEALLQTYLFAGFPAALESLSLLHARVRALQIPWYAEDDENYDVDRFLRRGVECCRSIYTSVYTTMRERLSVVSPHLDDWMVIEGYGKTLSRPRLDLVSRELVNVAVLSCTAWPRQLYSHLRGAMNVGASDEECRAALQCALELRGEGVFSDAMELWNKVKSER